MDYEQIIPWGKPDYWGNEKTYVNDALDSLWISDGKYINMFETEFAKLLNTKYAITTSNGTTAIHLAYLTLDLKPGDEIIIPGFGFLASANIATQMGLVPIFADVDPNTWCINLKEIEKRITKKTKAIIPIHTYGNVCDMNGIKTLAQLHNLTIIEDCAESLFSKFNNQYCGSFGDINCFSFQATKTITTGEGGMVVTNDEQLFNKMILYRSHGLTKRGRYWHELPGHNFRITNIQAALGLAQFEKKDTIIQEKKRIYSEYAKHLFEINGIKHQQFNNNVEPVIWAIAIQLEPNAFICNRDELIQILKSKGIETRPGFVASSQLPIYVPHTLSVSEELSNTVISLPSFSTITNEQIEYICKTLIDLKK